LRLCSTKLAKGFAADLAVTFRRSTHLRLQFAIQQRTRSQVSTKCGDCGIHFTPHLHSIPEFNDSGERRCGSSCEVQFNCYIEHYRSLFRLLHTPTPRSGSMRNGLRKMRYGWLLKRPDKPQGPHWCTSTSTRSSCRAQVSNLHHRLVSFRIKTNGIQPTGQRNAPLRYHLLYVQALLCSLT
jgi:hypothetical protein